MSGDAPRPIAPGWPYPESPFHAGEQAVQTRYGMRERMESAGRRVVRGFMPDEHRELFQKLPYLFVGSEDAQGRVWASLLTGEPGFVRCPDIETLSIRPAHLPESLGALRVGQKLGILGIELSTRRRNRANGVVCRTDEDGFSLHVEQSFGNCAKYIHQRPHRLDAGASDTHCTEEGPLLSPRALALIERADTLFIATTSGEVIGPAPERGLDVSHRGGPPGFVRVTSENAASVLSWADYRGNFMFCTLGNLELDSRAGLLFVDFESGSTLALTGRAVVVEGVPGGGEHPTGREFRFVATRGERVAAATALRWEPLE